MTAAGHLVCNQSFAQRTAQPSASPYKLENRVWGAVLEFFGVALRVEQANGKIDYVRTSELKNKFLLNKISNKADRKNAKQDAIVHDLFLSTINPFKNTPVRSETLHQFSQKLDVSDPEQLHSALREVRAALYTQKGMTRNPNEFIANIQVGDILFHRTDDSIHSDIVQLQQIANRLGLGPKHRDAVHHNHVYLCAKIDEFGKRWFAEAAWPSGKLDEIRLISEDDVERCFVKQNHGAMSELFRCTDPEWAKRAAEEALRITTIVQENEDAPTDLRYSIRDGSIALFGSNRFGHFAKMRLIQQIRSTNHGKQPTEFIHHKDFFCSSLVGYSYQVGEARPMVTEMLGEAKWKTPLRNRIHSNFLAIWHRNELNELRFKIDPKRSTPADLYSYLRENNALFSSIQSYQQPNIVK